MSTELFLSLAHVHSTLGNDITHPQNTPAWPGDAPTESQSTFSLRAVKTSVHVLSMTINVLV